MQTPVGRLAGCVPLRELLKVSEPPFPDPSDQAVPRAKQAQQCRRPLPDTSARQASEVCSQLTLSSQQEGRWLREAEAPTQPQAARSAGFSPATCNLPTTETEPRHRAESKYLMLIKFKELSNPK